MLACATSLSIIDKRYPDMQIHQQQITLNNSTISNVFAYAGEETFLIQKNEDLFTVFYSLPSESLTMTEVFRIPFNS